MQGNIQVPGNATIDLISSNGAVLADDSIAIYGVTPNIVAGKQVDVQIEGGKGPLNVQAGTDIRVDAISINNTSSRIIVGNINSNTGRIFLTGANGVRSANSASLVSGNRIEISANAGNIGTGSLGLRVDSDKLGDGGIIALASGDIRIDEVNGDMKLLRPGGLTTQGSIVSTTGNVTLNAANGSIRDGSGELFSAIASFSLNRFTANELSYINAGVAAGRWTLQSVSNPMSPGLMRFLYPTTSFLGPNPDTISVELPNVFGNNVTLTASSAGGQIGLTSDPVTIRNPGNYAALSAADAATLANSRAADVIGVNYALYRYLGSNQNGVNLKSEDYNNTARWQKLAIQFTTGTNNEIPIIRSVVTGNRVLVEFNREDYGVYEYLGSSASIDLATQNFRDTTRWRAVISDFSSLDTSANLVTNQVVINRSLIDSLTIQRIDDLDVEASNSLTATAHGRAAIGSSGEMLINRIVAGGDLSLNSASNIRDTYFDSIAALATGGSLRIDATGIIAAANTVNPLRMQVSPTGVLRAQGDGDVRLLQVGADATINGITQPINNLFAGRVDTLSSTSIEVAEGNLSVGRITATASVELKANGSILDGQADANGRWDNIRTSSSSGHISLTAGLAIGAPANFLDVQIPLGNLNSVSGQSTHLHSSSILNAQSVVSTSGSVDLLVDSQTNVGKVAATSGTVTINSANSIVDSANDAASDVDAINISLSVLNGSIGQTFDDLEIDTADTLASRLNATAPNSVYLTEIAGRLNVQQVVSTSQGNVRLSVQETLANGDDLTVVSGGNVTATNGRVILQAGDNIAVSGTLAGQSVYITGDYRSRDAIGTNIAVSGSVSAPLFEVSGDSDSDVIDISAVTVAAVIRGFEGDDDVTGGTGADQIFGGLGRDILRGMGGNDLIVADRGIGDILLGGDGDDQLFGSDEGAESDPDFADANRTGDMIDGGAGNDQIWSLGGADYILGGLGNDVIDSGTGSDLVRGNDGDDTIFVGMGLNDEAHGDAGNDKITGSNTGQDRLFGNDGNDSIIGQAGNDLLDGGDGDDFLDGGAGTDDISGGAGDDELIGGGGAGDILRGDDGNDLLRGSNDGPDNMFGGNGRDRMFGNGGNDVMNGGAADDTMDGGNGDDVLSGDSGSDIIVGGANNDVLYGLNLAGVGIDGAPDYLYGDFGNNLDDASSGRDQLFGASGIDVLIGEGGNDLIDNDTAVAGIPNPGSTPDIIDYGTGEGANPTTFVTPTPTANPAILPPPPAIAFGQATLPVGPAEFGRWGELGSSATARGLSGDNSVSSAPSVISSSTGPIAAWTDTRNGSSNIYVARFGVNGWQELAGSASFGGVSNSTTTSLDPSITLIDGNPAVAWTEWNGTSSDIRVALYDPLANTGSGGWIAMGPSLSASGVSATGAAQKPKIVQTSNGPVLAWLNVVGGTTQVYARRFVAGVWQPIGTASDTGTGLSGAAPGSGVANLNITASSSRIAVAWDQQDANGLRQIYLKEFDGTTWNSISGSGSGAGVSSAIGSSFEGVITHNFNPSVAYAGTDLFIAWQTYSDQSSAVVVQRYLNSTGSPVPASSSETLTRNAQPRLVSNGTFMNLLWIDGQDRLFTQRWNGTSFVEEVPGDASAIGITPTARNIQGLAASMDASGRATVVWEDITNGTPEVMVRTNSRLASGNTYVADGTTSIQQILENQALVAGDVILVTGTQPGFTVTAADAGVAIIGTPTSQIIGSIQINANDVVLQRLNVTGDVSLTNANRTAFRESLLIGSLIVNGGSDIQVTQNRITGASATIRIAGNATNTLVRANTIQGGATAISLGDPSSGLSGGANSVSIRGNSTSGTAIGLRILAASTGIVDGNDFSATTTALDLDIDFAGLVRNNRFRNAVTGVRYEFATNLSGNDISNNQIGVLATVNSTTTGLGFQPDATANRIFSNTTGVQLTGRMQGQHVYNNTTGVAGTGILVSTDLDRANLIEGNVTGVSLNGPVEFQRIARNSTGIVANSGQTIAHNLIYGNAVGVSVMGTTDTRIINNTFYTMAGDNVRVIGAARQTEVRNNILWTSNGYNLFVANDSTIGFFSDYNVLHTSGAGKIGYWTKDFTDILDWQEDIYQFDLHSIGTTVIDPAGAEPQFFNKSRDDFRIFNQLAGQRSTSPSIDAGDPLTDIALPASSVNLLANPSFESGLTGWIATPSGAVQSSNPNPFEAVNYFAGGANPTTTLTQTVDLLASGFTAAQLDSNDFAIAFGGRVRSADEEIRDKGTLTVSILDAADAVIGSPAVIASANVATRWELLGGRLNLPTGARKVRYSFEAVRQTGTTNDVYLDRAFVSVGLNSLNPDAGALGTTVSESTQNAHLILRSPDLYKDWERDKPLSIRWDSLGNINNSLVVIDLYQDTPNGPTPVTRITGGTPDDGEFTWIAANSGIAYGTYGLRIQVSLANNIAVLDRSTETFTVPENTNTFFVNDGSTVGDEYVGAAGSNRNTGKLSSIPKPYPNNVLRIYSVSANQTLSVDTGTYPLIYPLVVSNVLGIGDDEGFRMRGAANGLTSLYHANPFTVASIIELNNADFVTLDTMEVRGGTKGLWVRNTSTNLSANRFTSRLNSQEGIRLEAGSSILLFDGVNATGNGGNGMWINGSVATLRNGLISNNSATGLVLQNVGNASVYGNEIANNIGRDVYGIQVTNVNGGMTVIGDPNLTLGRGNRIHDNTSYGINATGSVQIVGNTVYNHVGVENYGIVGTSSTTISKNVVRANTNGISVSGISNTVQGNRVYNNAGVGIALVNGSSANQNVVYSNAVGIRSNSAALTNNVVYANTNRAIQVDGGSFGTLVNNTIHQAVGEAIRISGNASNFNLRNNIFWVDGGVAISVANDSQTGFASDFNNFFVNGGGHVANWQSLNRTTLATWQTTAFTDANSFTQDPRFVAIPGADGVLGYSNNSNDGRDDDFHERSLYGSFKGGAFAPVATNNGIGAPAELTGAYSVDGQQSPVIDRGAPADGFRNEPANAGNFINVGAFGNTNQASKSPAQYVLVTKPDGGENWPASQSFPIRWRSHDLNRYALAFDGTSDFVHFGDQLDLGNADFTIETWFKGDPTMPAGGRILDKGATTGYSLGRAGTTAKIHFQFLNSPAGFTTTSDLIDNNWHHIAVVKSGTTISLYADGSLENTQTVGIASQNSNLALLMGAVSGESSQAYWKGSIDETRIWTIARTQSQIQNSRNTTLQGNELGLAAYYRMDEGSGVTLFDEHTPANDGILGNSFASQMPTWTVSQVPQNVTYNIELLRQGNPTPVSTIASNAPGTGEYIWNIPLSITPASDYLIRVSRNDASALSDTSDAPINITAPISRYYVNDSTVNTDDWTTAPGNDANDGLSPATPKASIAAILAAYDLGAGDTIIVDAGNYSLSSNIVVTNNDSGVVIEGYHDTAFPDRVAILNRGNTGAGAFVFDLQNADDLTLSYLQIMGGSIGVNASSTSDSDRLKILNSRIERNLQYGLFLDSGNDFVTISNNRFDNVADQSQQNYHMWVFGADAMVTNNYLTKAGFDAIYVRGARGIVEGNDLVSNGRGNSGSGIIAANFSTLPTDRIIIRNNRVSGSTNSGISGDVNTLIIANTVFNQLTGNQTGISSAGEVRDNIVFDNGVGIAAGQGTIINNRVFHNTVFGLNINNSARAIGNRVYDNRFGIRYAGAVPLSNNIVYNNTFAGILVDGTSGPFIENNTIYQPTGNGIQVQSFASNVRLRNNIIWTSLGYGISVTPDSQTNFRSDYNVFHFTGSGRLGLWGNQTIQSLVDWNYELGLDVHSIIADPQFVDLDGADDLSGYSRGGGLQASFFNNSELSGSPVLQRRDNEINFNWGNGSPIPDVGADNFSARWEGYVYIPTPGNYRFYTRADDGVRLYLNGVLATDQWVYSGFGENVYNANGLTVGWYPIVLEMRETTGSAAVNLSWDGPSISKRLINEDYLGVTPGYRVANFGADDDFHVLPTSPAVDRGDLLTYYLSEVAPNGDRIDAGAYGDTDQANISPARSIQVLNPNGLEKFELGQTIDVSFRSTGLTSRRPVALINSGNGPIVDNYLADAYRLNGTVGSTTNAINLSGVTAPAPEAVYKTFVYGPSGMDAKLTYAFPIPDGNYTLRLHFVEPTFGVGQRLINIVGNGTVLVSNYDIAAASGGLFRANVQEVNVTVAGGLGLNLDLVSKTSREAILSGIEILATNANGSSNPLVDLQYSIDGNTWTTFASSVPMDRFGRGSYSWSVPASLAEGNYQIRATSGIAELQVQDASDAAFSIMNGGTDYYINDNSTVGDTFTTAIGNNNNSGKSPSQPMASLSALIAAYDLDPGDVIHVDSGNYNLIQNIVLTNQDSGVRIEGPANQSAILNRNNTNGTSFIFELQNADQITVDRFTLTGGYAAVLANSTSDSDQFTLSNSRILLNVQYGVFLEQSNDGAQLLNNYFDGGASQVQNYHIWTLGSDTLVQNNTFTKAGFDAINTRGARSIVDNNILFDNGRGNSGIGITTSNLSAAKEDRIVVSNNRVSGSTASGITANANVLIIGNTVFNMLTGGVTGISSFGSEVRDNEVFESGIGIAALGGLVVDNHVYRNTIYGITTSSSTRVAQNAVYDNMVGIRVGTSSQGFIVNNQIYNNQTAAILLEGSFSADISNNSIYQPIGHGILAQSGASNSRLRNNIVTVGTGVGILIQPDSEFNFQSDYNQFFLTGNGKIGQLGGQTFASQSDWFFQAGLDRNSFVADPQWTDLDGVDDQLGYRAGDGLLGSYFNNNSLSGTPVLQRKDAEINFNWAAGSPDPSVPADNFSVRWTGFVYVPADGNYRFYAQAEDGIRLYLDGVLRIDQWIQGFSETAFAANSYTKGWHPITVEMRETTNSSSVRLSWDGPNISKRIINNGYLATTNDFTPGNRGNDDNFNVLPTSPSIDRGDIQSAYVLEPFPNGSRINIGATGNTPSATLSPEQFVQIISPNGNEKFEVGQPIPIEIRTAGQSLKRPVILMTNGSTAVGEWQPATTFQLTGSTTPLSGNIDLSGIASPAPASVYNSLAFAGNGVGAKLTYDIPMPNGTYDIRLHFVEPTFNVANSRIFSIGLENSIVASNYDIFAQAGGRMKAVASQYAGINVADGSLRIDLTNVLGQPALLSAIEVLATNSTGVASPTIDIQYSPNNGSTWSPLFTNLPLDRFGRANVNWVAPSATDGNTAMFRAIANQGSQLQDETDGRFLITNNGSEYYLSPTGNNANSGKSPDQPMMTLAALLDAYDLDSGDTVNVTTGTYSALRNIRFVAQDSGVTIRGQSPNGVLFDRNNPNSTRYNIELINADNVTIDSIEFKNAERSVFAANNSDSDDFTLINSKLFANAQAGLDFGSTNDRLTVTNSKIFGLPGGTNTDDQFYGINLSDPNPIGHILSGNEIYDNSVYGVYLRGANNQVINNDLHGNRIGINVAYQGAVSGSAILSNNKVRDNTQTGIEASSNVILTNNEVFGHTGSNDLGISADSGVQVLDNVIRNNFNGLSISGASLASDNRLYGNTNAAMIVNSTAKAIANYVYSNSIGIQAISSFSGQIANNLIYANSNQGILLQNNGSFASTEILNNTVYQSVGEAIRLDSAARNVKLYNNLVWVLSGFDIYVATDSQIGFDSDHNLLHQGDDVNAHVGFWGNTVRDSLADWRTATGRDGNSIAADPDFVDIDGADNILGFVSSGGGQHGGEDDNFYRAKQSPAIDRGHSWNALRTDIEGLNRVDDAAITNSGSLDYFASALETTIFAPAFTGTPQNWRADDSGWELILPFNFAFYGTSYSSVFVSSNGFLQFGNNANISDGGNSTAKLQTTPRIAPLWDDLRTDGIGDDIFVDSSVNNQVTIRWNATNKATGGDVNFAATLFNTGEVRFHYGAGNSGLTPTIGTSAGTGSLFTMSTYNDRSSLENANSVAYQGSGQWASTVIGFSSQFSPSSWSAAQALGAPNTNSYGDFATAWAPASGNGTIEFISLGFAQPVYSDGIIIRETFGNGFVTKVELIDTSDVLHTVFTGPDPSLPGAPVNFQINWPLTSYLVKGAKITIDTTREQLSKKSMQSSYFHRPVWLNRTSTPSISITSPTSGSHKTGEAMMQPGIGRYPLPSRYMEPVIRPLGFPRTVYFNLAAQAR